MMPVSNLDTEPLLTHCGVTSGMTQRGRMAPFSLGALEPSWEGLLPDTCRGKPMAAETAQRTRCEFALSSRQLFLPQTQTPNLRPRFQLASPNPPTPYFVGPPLYARPPSTPLITHLSPSPDSACAAPFSMWFPGWERPGRRACSTSLWNS